MTTRWIAAVDCWAQVPVPGVWQGVLSAVAAARSSALAHRWEAVRLRSLRQGVRRPVQPARAHPDALGHQELRVRAMPATVRAQVLPQQALQRGRRLRRSCCYGCRTYGHWRAPAGHVSTVRRRLQPLDAGQQRTGRRSRRLKQCVECWVRMRRVTWHLFAS